MADIVEEPIRCYGFLDFRWIAGRYVIVEQWVRWPPPVAARSTCFFFHLPSLNAASPTMRTSFGVWLGVASVRSHNVCRARSASFLRLPSAYGDAPRRNAELAPVSLIVVRGWDRYAVVRCTWTQPWYPRPVLRKREWLRTVSRQRSGPVARFVQGHLVASWLSATTCLSTHRASACAARRVSGSAVCTLSIAAWFSASAFRVSAWIVSVCSWRRASAKERGESWWRAWFER